MVIILEGPDGSGKTTLANALQAKGFKYLHNGLYPSLTTDQLAQLYMKQIMDALQETNDAHCIGTSDGDHRHVVIDRSFMSEYIYGRVMRDFSRLTMCQVTALADVSFLLGVRHIICLPPWEIVFENWWKKRKDKWDPEKRTGDYVDAEDKIKRIYELYAGTRYRFSNELQRYDYTQESTESMIGSLRCE